MLLEKTNVGILSPQLAHGEDKGIEGDQHQSNEGEEEQDFEQREGATAIEGMADAHFHFFVPWISAMRSRTAWRSWGFSVASDQVGRSTVNVWVVFSGSPPLLASVISQTKVTVKRSGIAVLGERAAPTDAAVAHGIKLGARLNFGPVRFGKELGPGEGDVLVARVPSGDGFVAVENVDVGGAEDDRGEREDHQGDEDFQKAEGAGRGETRIGQRPRRRVQG